MIRWLFNIASVLSLLLSVAAIVLWTISPWDVWLRAGSISSGDGKIGLFTYRAAPQLPLMLSIHYWILILLFLWFPVLWLLDQHHGLPARRRLRGLCGKCGYNLTGNTSGVCPECGTPIAAKRAAAVPIIPCPVCSYDLSGNTSGACPECGTKLGPSAPRRSPKDLGADVQQLNVHSY
jgi:predicted amidophosphoribosyltransferase